MMAARPACSLWLIFGLLLSLVATSASAQPIPIRKTPHNDSTPTTNPQDASQPAEKQTTRPGPGFDMWKMALSLAIVLSLIFILRWVSSYLMGNRGIVRGPEVIQIVSRKIVAPKQQMMLVQVGRRVVLVGNSGGQMNALAEIDDPEEIAELLGRAQTERPESITRAFGSLFKRAEEKYETAPETGLPPEESPRDDATLEETRSELSGLMDRVKEMSKQYREK